MKDDVNRDVHLNSVMDVSTACCIKTVHVINNNLSVHCFFISFQRNWTALMKAAQIGDVNIAKMLIGAGASLTAKAKVITRMMVIPTMICALHNIMHVLLIYTPVC